MKKSIFFAFFILLIAIGWLASGQNKNIKNDDDIKEDISTSKNSNEIDQLTKKENLFKVETKRFTSEEIDRSITVQGQTIYNKKIDVKSETTGNITELNFKRGDNIKKGSLLVKISNGNRNELLNSAKELIELYELEYSTTKKLIDKGLSSKSKLALASYNLTDAKSKLKNIQLDIENTNIKAPFDGIITETFIELSDFVTTGNILLTVVSLNPIKIKGYLSEFDIDKIKKNTNALIENSNGIKKTGKISFISPTAETSTRTFEILIEADNSDLLFKSGITTSIKIEGSKQQAHKIPPSILTLQDDGTIGVKALTDNNKVIFYPIKKVRDSSDGMWVSGLPNKINLIISGQEYVNTGQSIDIE